MLRTLAATALGLSLALTPLATAPAHALDDRQAAGIVAGAIILGLGAALAQNGTVGVQVQPPRHYQRRAYDLYPGYRQHRLDRAQSVQGGVPQSFHFRKAKQDFSSWPVLRRKRMPHIANI